MSTTHKWTDSSHFLADLARRGITLRIVEDGLASEPRGTLTRSDRAYIREHRAELMDHVMRRSEGTWGLLDQLGDEYARCSHSPLLALYAADAAEFVELIGDPERYVVPAGYPGRLPKMLSWLKDQTGEKATKAREAALKKLLSLEAQMIELVESEPHGSPVGDIRAERGWGELPLWIDDEDGQLAETWWCYSGALLYLNARCGYGLCDVSLRGVAL